MRGRAVRYSAEEELWMEENRWIRANDLHHLFIETFQRDDVTQQNLEAYRKRKGWKKGRADNSANLKHFSKGYKPWNRADHGEERVSSKGFLEVRTDKGWIAKSRVLWEEKFGEIPSGMVLKAIDGDRDNLDPMNWKPVSRRVLALLSIGHGRSIPSFSKIPKEARPSVVVLAELKSTIKDAEAAAVSIDGGVR